MTPTATLADTARAWHARGYTPLPLRTDGSKAPAIAWKTYQHGITDAELATLFQRDTDGLGLLCGAASGQLEMLELEGRAVREGVLPRLIQAMDDHEQRPLWDRIAAGYVELTPSGGLHYHYRVDGPARGNTKLARRPATPDELAEHPSDRIKVLIETRGEGGFTVIAPSGGRSHPSGRAWIILAGSMDTIPTLTVEERDAIHAIATLLDDMPDPTSIATPHVDSATPHIGDPAGGRPGDDYNTRATWDDILTPRGWTRAPGHYGHDRIGWVRPGKQAGQGISATSGGADDGIDRLYVFSSSTELPTEKPLTKFAALAWLDHGGDYAACARRLADDGYGAPTEPGPALTLAGQANNVIPLHPAAPPIAGATALAPIADADAAAHGPNAAAVLGTVSDIELARFGKTEDGVARALVARCHDQLRFCPQRGLWLTWDGSRWVWDEGERHRELARQLARQLPDNESWKAFRTKMLSSAGVSGVVRLARTDEAITVHIDDLDAHPWQLNTPSGVIDMRTGLLTPADRAALHTRATTVTPDYETPAPVWESFLSDTFGGNADLIAYMQRLLGITAVGQVLEQQLPFAFGAGANGKSTLMNVVMKVLGRGRDGYATALDSEALMVRKHSEHPAELAQLAGARMVVSSEIEDGHRFAEARVKQLTGGDAISARFMRGNPFTFTPSHTLWLVGNHQPGTTAGGPAFWRRIKLIPFEHIVPEERRDPHLEDKLTAEAPQILAWIARGAADYHTHGLGTPDAVTSATAAYRDDQDSVGKFVAEACMRTAAGRVKVADLRAAYERFCRETGDAPVSAKRLGEQLRDQHGIQLSKSGSVRTYSGITLYADEEGPDEPDDWRSR